MTATEACQSIHIIFGSTFIDSIEAQIYMVWIVRSMCPRPQYEACSKSIANFEYLRVTYNQQQKKPHSAILWIGAFSGQRII